MIRRSTWILLGLFVLVLGFGYFFQQYKTQHPSPTATAAALSPTSSPLFQVDEKTINSLRVENNQGKLVVLGRDASGVWMVTEPKGPTDTGKAEQFVSQLVSFQATTTLNATTDLTIYGLAKAADTITLTLNGGEKHVIEVGDATPTGNGYYIRVDGKAPQIVDKSSMDTFLGILTNPPFSTPTPAASASAGSPGTPPAGGATGTAPAEATATGSPVTPTSAESGAATPTP